MLASSKSMRAIVIDGTCEAEALQVSKIPIPEVKPGWVLVHVHAAGVNRAELILRAEEADEDYIATPIVPGIECAGEVVDPGDSDLTRGQKVIGIMGGMGRSFDGSYAEYCLVPRKNLFTVETNLSWDELASIPESWFTAWGSLVQSLDVKPGESLLIRGGTSSLGVAALAIAKGMGLTVVSTTRNEKGKEKLYELGCERVFLDDGSLAEQVSNVMPEGFDAVLELIGPRTLLESLEFTKLHGRVCMTGVLGGIYELNDFDPIKDIPSGVYLTGFYSNYPQQKDIDAVLAFIEKHEVHPYIGARFDLADTGKAHAAIEAGEVFGKVLLTMDLS